MGFVRSAPQLLHESLSDLNIAPARFGKFVAYRLGARFEAGRTLPQSVGRAIDAGSILTP